jgi:hypothetical protein
MSQIWEAVTHVSAPIPLIAFAVAALLLGIQMVLRLRIFPRIKSQDTAKLLRQVIHSLTLIVILIILFAFGTIYLSYSAKNNPKEAWEDRPVTISFRKAPPSTVFAKIAGQIGTQYAIQKDLKLNPISMSVESGRLSDVMDAICAANHCAWEVLPRGKSPLLFIHSAERSPREP